MKLFILSIITGLSSFFTTIHTSNYISLEESQDINLEKSIERGKIVYKEFCIRCHKENGEGKGKFYPPLAKSDWLKDKRIESIRAVKYGLKGAITVNGVDFKRSMSNPGLENEEIVDVMNYIMNSWGNTQEEIVTLEEVEKTNKL